MINMLANKKWASVIGGAVNPIGEPKAEEDEVNEDAQNLELMKEFISAVKEGKAEKALRAFKMICEDVCEDCIEESEQYDGMKFANPKGE